MWTGGSWGGREDVVCSCCYIGVFRVVVARFRF